MMIVAAVLAALPDCEPLALRSHLLQCHPRSTLPCRGRIGDGVAYAWAYLDSAPGYLAGADSLVVHFQAHARRRRTSGSSPALDHAGLRTAAKANLVTRGRRMTD